MALNWTMLTEDGSRPIPLPGEKIFFSVQQCNCSLDFKNHGVKWSANGNAFVTSQRILFVRQPPLPAPADPSLSSAHLRSLSVPLSQFIDTRYLIPIFSAPYYEATIIPSRDGGLPQPGGSGGQAATGLFKLWFSEGGGMTFRDAVEEVKSRMEEGSTHVEALPLYEPATGTSAGNMAPNSSLDVPNRRISTRSDSMPHPEDVEAARIAREAEERERDSERQRAQVAAASAAPVSAIAAQRQQQSASQELPPPYLP